MSQRLGLVPAAEVEQRALKSESYIGGKLVEENDLVLNRLKAHLGVFARAKKSGLTSPDYTVLRPDGNANIRFYEYVLKSLPCRAELRVRAKGIVEGFWRLYTNDFYEIRLPVPPPEEQRLIVKFLDWHGLQTMTLIRAKKKLSALLNEQKQVIVHSAVTRGLDPTAKVRPSGIPWLGDVPEGWEVLALKRISSQRCDGPFGSGLKSSHYTSSGVLVVRLQNIGRSVFKTAEPAYISEDHYASLGNHTVLPGDILIAGLGDDRNPCGRACVAPDSLGRAMVKADCFRFRLNPERALSQFLSAALTATAEASSAILSAGATRQRVNLQATAERAVALPSVVEQNQIANHLKRVDVRFQPLLEAVEREISLLQELRLRLIADVVTGKLDVRAASASLTEFTAGPINEHSADEDFDDVDDVSTVGSPESAEAAA